MDTFDAIHQRRSVKAFDPTHRFTAAEETKLFDAALQSPTSFNMQNWRFMIAVGKAVKPAMPKGGQLALSEVVVQDRFA